MKQIRFLTFVLAIGTLLLSACGATPGTATPAAESTGQKVEAMPVAFVGIVDSIAGDQWVISGTTVTVDDSIVHDGPFSVGDRVKVEGFVHADGSLTVSRVETPAPHETATLPPTVADNSNEAISNANTNDANVNDDSSSAVNSNDDNGNSSNSNDASTNVNDDHGNDVNTNDDNSNSANSNDTSTNVNDDNGGNGNSSDDNSSSANTNDDNGGNSNGDNGGGGNSNDDKGGGGGNSNDDNGNGG